MAKIAVLYLAVVNIAAFALYGIDKRKAVRQRWRIPEATLIAAAFVGGAAGALLGMLLFHHKTRKWKFRILVPLALVLWTGLLFFIFSHQTSPARPDDRFRAQIEQVHSSVDKDGDGVDDQVDILQGALAYVGTKPKYKSKYYSTGYPDDGYGVCTDVVAFAMRSAGYDLMELVEEDIRAHPDDYNIEVPDKNIDFRRVQNLKVWFKNNAISLTTDVSDIRAWQGGDIVIFENHIGVVSDRRNKNGMPYVIHHNDPYQKSYEQDILEKRDDIVGHYRVSE